MLKVNLQPKVMIEAKEGFKMPLWPVIVLGIIVVLGIGGTWYMMRSNIMAAESEIKDLDFKLKDFQKVLDEYEQAKNEKSYLEGKRNFVNSISQNQKQWIEFFDEVKTKMPKDVWLTRFEGERSGQYNVEGVTFTYSSVGFFMLQFNSIPHISSVSLDQASESSSGRASGDETFSSITKMFKITGDMKLAAKEKQAPEEKAKPAAGTRRSSED